MGVGPFARTVVSVIVGISVFVLLGVFILFYRVLGSSFFGIILIAACAGAAVWLVDWLTDRPKT